MHTKFLSWCAARGITTPLTLSQLPHDPSYRYLSFPASASDFTASSSSSSLPAGSEIIRVPLAACLIDDCIENLAGRLAHERSLGPKSDYAPYMDVLPLLPLSTPSLGSSSPSSSSSILTLPRFWPERRLRMVTDGGFLEARMREDERPRVDPWGLAIVNSRSNVLPGSLYSISPLLDMFNHDPTVITSARIHVDQDNGTDDALCLSVNKSYQPGEEVCISYDRGLTNLDTLVNYGFVSPNNLNDLYNSEMVTVRMIRQPAPCVVVVEADGSISNAALAPLRKVLATPEEVDRARRGVAVGNNNDDDDDDGGAGKAGGALLMMDFASPLSLRNEEEVMAVVAVAIDDAACEAEIGADVVAKEADDWLVEAYLSGRARTLRRALKVIGTKFPDLGY